jgi:Ni/Co efflux regulator RcnB
MLKLKFIIRILFLSALLAAPVLAVSQEAKTEKAPATTKAQRKKAKQKWKENRKIEMEHKKMVKEHHKRIQTKGTRKRMKEEKRKSDRYRENKREFFIVRWFKNRKR